MSDVRPVILTFRHVQIDVHLSVTAGRIANRTPDVVITIVDLLEMGLAGAGVPVDAAAIEKDDAAGLGDQEHAFRLIADRVARRSGIEPGVDCSAAVR